MLRTSDRRRAAALPSTCLFRTLLLSNGLRGNVSPWYRCRSSLLAYLAPREPSIVADAAHRICSCVRKGEDHASTLSSVWVIHWSKWRHGSKSRVFGSGVGLIQRSKWLCAECGMPREDIHLHLRAISCEGASISRYGSLSLGASIETSVMGGLIETLSISVSYTVLRHGSARRRLLDKREKNETRRGPDNRLPPFYFAKALGQSRTWHPSVRI